MKALTISQPYASLIADGAKWVENRVWRTGYRGPLAIHAGSGTQYLTKKELARYPTGCVIAVADLVACVWLIDVRRLREATVEQLRAAHIDIDALLGHRYTEGPWCWVLRNVRQIEPVAARGSMGLWEWEEPRERKEG